MSSDSHPKSIPLGERLLREGLISPQQLKEALEEQKSTGQLLAQILIDRGFVDEEKVNPILAKSLGVDYVDLSRVKIDKKLKDVVPEDICRRYIVIPLRVERDTLVVAMSEPQNTFAIDELRAETGFKIKPVLGGKKSIAVLINRLYGEKSEIENTLTVAVEEEFKEEALEEDVEKIREVAEKAPIIRFVDAVISDAIKNRASDIHIEPHRQDFKIRFRIDGVLHDITTSPKALFKPVVSRIKIMSNLDIAEKRLPQDGGFRVEFLEKQVDIRVSTYPTINGEKIVLRLFTKDISLLNLEQLGFETKEFEIFDSLIHRPCGIILVTGPTGSGKSTTLYAALNRINSPDKNIVTVEDPVEYKIEGISQSQVNPRAGFTFSNSLRAIMRQDPDVIMVGEIRDLETAQLAVRASLTGHLVLSTLHTNDAPSATTRLIDMGIEPYLVSASLIGVLAQRLVRVICSKCKEQIPEPRDIIPSFREELERVNDLPLKFFQGKGCEFCRNTGFRGRQAIYELMTVSTDRMRDAISSGVKLSQIRVIALEEGMRTLKENGLRKVFRGISTLGEVLRVTEVI